MRPFEPKKLPGGCRPCCNIGMLGPGQGIWAVKRTNGEFLLWRGSTESTLPGTIINGCRIFAWRTIWRVLLHLMHGVGAVQCTLLSAAMQLPATQSILQPSDYKRFRFPSEADLTENKKPAHPAIAFLFYPFSSISTCTSKADVVHETTSTAHLAPREVNTPPPWPVSAPSQSSAPSANLALIAVSPLPISHLSIVFPENFILAFAIAVHTGALHVATDELSDMYIRKTVAK